MKSQSNDIIDAQYLISVIFGIGAIVFVYLGFKSLDRDTVISSSRAIAYFDLAVFGAVTSLANLIMVLQRKNIDLLERIVYQNHKHDRFGT